MSRTLLVFLLLPVALTGHAQSGVSAGAEASSSAHVSADAGSLGVASKTPQQVQLDRNKRCAELRAALRVQAHSQGKPPPHRLTLAERAQLRRELKAQRQLAISQTP